PIWVAICRRLHRFASAIPGGGRRMSVKHEPSVTTVFSRSPDSARLVRSLFTPLHHDVRSLRGRVPIPACASSSARARSFEDWRGAGGGDGYPTDHGTGHFAPRRSARQAPADPY